MTTAESRKRLKQLASAMTEVGGMPRETLADNIRRVLRLMDLVPWLSEDEASDLTESADRDRVVK